MYIVHVRKKENTERFKAKYIMKTSPQYTWIVVKRGRRRGQKELSNQHQII